MEDPLADSVSYREATPSDVPDMVHSQELVVLDGSAHAQFIFETSQGERLMREILRFLSEQ